jgi:hypothetical protein
MRPDTEEAAYTEGTEIDRDEVNPDETPDSFTTSVQLRQGDVPANIIFIYNNVFRVINLT